jgi:uncharacterized membrane protein YdbT with pleckstrin-like domain
MKTMIAKGENDNYNRNTHYYLEAPMNDIADGRRPITLRPAWRREWFSILLVLVGLAIFLKSWTVPLTEQLQALMRGFGLLLTVIYLIVAMWSRHQWLFFIGPYGVESSRGIIGRDERRAEYRHISYVRFHQSVAQRLFGIGNILIGTSATNKPELVFYGIRKPKYYKDIIQARMREKPREE